MLQRMHGSSTVLFSLEEFNQHVVLVYAENIFEALAN